MRCRMPSPWWKRLLLRVRRVLFCRFGWHVGRYRNVQGGVWCPNCQREVEHARPR